MENLDSLLSMDIVLPIAIGMGAVLLMRMMPRLLARGVSFVPPKTVKARLDQGDDVLVVDVRSPREFAGRTGHIPGAVNLPLDQIGARLKEMGASRGEVLDTPVYLVCQTASRAAHAARVMRKAGFRDLSVISGGMQAWRGQGLPVEQGNAT
ncbi:rhodanese-like domain-containing protein [Roseospira marina]|uniref:rhodanese-like domain-containing protein n=1 Tax=Roseospira marina TaxID=140057 RepID=UPI00147823EE|nr:rhodanese-like domain-containing protein [Roseospira marina]MBB4313082.1 rhodanese-related sulfurtransferase [Roseospira marina]MBB5086177.1 rhodanese-related sulfurtransferase [Roseospira marina]